LIKKINGSIYFNGGLFPYFPIKGARGILKRE